MFTGIVLDVGTVRAQEPRGGDVRIVIGLDRIDPAGLRIGDSVCVQGCCLTVTELMGQTFAADVSRETLSLTTLGDLAVGSPVNLEPSLKAGDALGGHLVSGHVDGVGSMVARREEGSALELTIAAPPEVARTLVPKGSIAVDGVSLTINQVSGDRFTVMLIPHTLAVTKLGGRAPGAPVNLEADLIAKHVDRLVDAALERRAAGGAPAPAAPEAKPSLTLETLRRHGFAR